MKINQIMKKLQKAITASGFVVTMATTQFYSKDQKRYITIYILNTPILTKDRHGEWKNKDYQIIRSASVIDVMNCLVDVHKAVREWRG